MKPTTILTRDIVDIDKLLDEALQETFRCATTASVPPAVRPARVVPAGHVATAPAKLARRLSGNGRTGMHAGAGRARTASQGARS
ncbi:hypothetical protein [Paraburkholderia unamae]|uniref:hypothetical protein n=1 Tax=Paraburkholderia unamae TaxID=219649 RepID=UPI000DC2CFA7|nr:hypothetical protein C7401_124112 [Paraburkholderia unamae]